MLTANTMAFVKLSSQFEYASGSWKKPKKINGHNHGNYVVSQHRVAATQNPMCNRAYTPNGDTYERTTPLTSKELDARARFTAVAAAVKARKEDLSQITQDQINFASQKDQPDGKKTMRAYLWKVCGEKYDSEHAG